MRISTPKCASMIKKTQKNTRKVSTVRLLKLDGTGRRSEFRIWDLPKKFQDRSRKKLRGGVVDHNLGAIQGPSKSILKAEVDGAEGLRISRYKVRPKKQD